MQNLSTKLSPEKTRIHGETMSDKPKIWNIWKPKDNHPHWKPDEQTYAVQEGRGHYNDEVYEIIDRAVTMSAYETLREQLEMAIDVIRIISKGCPSHSPTCTCLRDHAYIALFKLEDLESPKCICSEINSRHCPVHQELEKCDEGE